MLERINQQLTEISALLATLAAILGFRKRITNFIVRVWKFITAPERLESQMKILIEGAEAREKELKRINYALFNDGQNGISHQVARLAACHAAHFEFLPFPSFECSITGENTRVNEAYRILTEIWRSEEVSPGSWLKSAHGDLLPAYIKEFDRCSKAGEDFIGTLDFKNPITDEHRGRWKIYASASPIGDTYFYIGRFIAAVDQTARDIAIENGWNVRVN